MPTHKPMPTYRTLVGAISEVSGYPRNMIVEILAAFPVGLSILKEGNWVSTPLGVFRMTRRRGRKILLPGGGRKADIEEKLIIRLRPGPNLQLDPGPEQPEPDEDPGEVEPEPELEFVVYNTVAELYSAAGLDDEKAEKIDTGY